MSIENIDIKEATIIDVRTPGEFMMGNVEGSINIPLDEVSSRVEEFKNIEGNLVLCCASGGRSGQATTVSATKWTFKCVQRWWLANSRLANEIAISEEI